MSQERADAASQRSADLLARLVEVEQRLARHEAGNGARQIIRTHRSGRRGWWAGAIVAILVALVPLSLLGADPVFSDLGTAGAEHRADIQTLGAAGITTGFDDPTSNDPNLRLYDPKGLVTREQMASFLARTAGLGDNPPVANAETASTALKLATDPASTVTFAANDLIRIASFNSGDDFFLPASPAPPTRDLQTLTIQVPTQSYLLFQFTGYMIAKQGVMAASLQGNVRLDGGDKKLLTIANLAIDSVATYPGTFDRQPVAGSYVFLATAGTHTVTLSIDRLSGSSTDIGLAAPSIQVLAIPFGTTGAGATAVPSGSSGDGNASSSGQP